MALSIENGDTEYSPVIVGNVKLTFERKNTPGRLSFKVVNDAILNFREGNAVKLSVNNMPMFRGYVFTKRRDAIETISVTAYDQLRYLKNKDTYTYSKLKASELVVSIANDFMLKCGEIEDTGFVIESGVEENQTLFDIIQNALDKTLLSKKTLYVLYDDYGELMLKNVESMKLDLMINPETAETYDYSSSIDEQTYNQIKLTYDNKETGYREIYITQDSGRMDDWGVLQYFNSINNPNDGIAQVEAMLSLYNQKTRRLTVKNAFGDVRVRAGCSVFVFLELGDVTVQNYMVVEKVTHIFDTGQHLMDLALIGGEFVA